MMDYVERLRGLWGRVRGWFGPPSGEEIRGWLVDDAPPITPERRSIPLRDYVDRFLGFWGRIRTRLFRVFAALLAVLCVAAGVLLYSNIWYMNLLLYGIIVPNFLILIHYMRLTKNG